MCNAFAPRKISTVITNGVVGGSMNENRFNLVSCATRSTISV